MKIHYQSRKTPVKFSVTTQDLIEHLAELYDGGDPLVFVKDGYNVNIQFDADDYTIKDGVVTFTFQEEDLDVTFTKAGREDEEDDE